MKIQTNLKQLDQIWIKLENTEVSELTQIKLNGTIKIISNENSNSLEFDDMNSIKTISKYQQIQNTSNINSSETEIESTIETGIDSETESTMDKEKINKEIKLLSMSSLMLYMIYLMNKKK